MSKTNKIDIYRRRLEVRDYILKGWKDNEIMEKTQISRDTLTEDKKAINDQYMKAVTENKHILAKQAEHIMKHLDQLDMIKKRLWDIQDDADTPTKTKIDTLKTILQELEHESKIFRLIDTSNTIIKQYIHIDKLNILMEKVTDVVREFVPPEKQRYAFDRLKGLAPILDVEGEVSKDEPKADQN